MKTQTSRYAYDRNYYTNLAKNNAFNGNAARQLAPSYDYDEEDSEEDLYYEDEADYSYESEKRRIEIEREPKADGHRSERVSASPKKHYKVEVHLFSILVFSASLAALVFSAFLMIEVQSKITQTGKEIKNATVVLNDIESLNASLSASLDTELDRNYIYSIAVGKFGMVYPDKNQVVYYKPADVGYVHQMNQIPD